MQIHLTDVKTVQSGYTTIAGNSCNSFTVKHNISLKIELIDIEN